jgi:hypothetical protein
MHTSAGFLTVLGKSGTDEHMLADVTILILESKGQVVLEEEDEESKSLLYACGGL